MSGIRVSEKSIVIEWSESQQCFHVESLAASIERNVRNYMLGRSNDYQVVWIVENPDDANQRIAELQVYRSLLKKNPLSGEDLGLMKAFHKAFHSFAELFRKQ